jgi:hypothetical protein
MIGRAFVAAAFLAASASVPAIAQQARSKGSDYSNKKVCKVQDRIGSRLGGKRMCRSQSEWDQEAREARLSVSLMQASRQNCIMGSNSPSDPNVGVPNCGN